jgi:hypothetical protein
LPLPIVCASHCTMPATFTRAADQEHLFRGERVFIVTSVDLDVLSWPLFTSFCASSEQPHRGAARTGM